MYTVKLAYRNNYNMAIEAIYGEPMYVGLIRGTVITANTFSSKSAFRAQLVNVLVFFFSKEGEV